MPLLPIPAMFGWSKLRKPGKGYLVIAVRSLIFPRDRMAKVAEKGGRSGRIAMLGMPPAKFVPVVRFP